ncbi:methylmalonyl-CoA epimerase [Alphaproteobacteria bacterium]|nr:methylmalonyl-CoA epimerase [Alphaproteobacteria bacterium]
MIGRLNHVGVATPSIDDSIKLYRDVLGATHISEKFALPEQGVWVCFVDIENSQIELIEPYDESSTITGFLKNNPAGGQHHVCYEVADIHVARDEMIAKGVRVLGEPRIGAHGTLIVFLHPKDMGGVLIELMETPK